MTFKEAKDAVAFHVELQAALVSDDAEWPARFAQIPMTRPAVHPMDASANLYHGLTVSLGMSVGHISKALERSRANYLGPTCNRAARVSGLSRNGQLLMCESEFNDIKEQVPDHSGRAPFLRGEVKLREQTLKGIKGQHNIVYLNTDPLTRTRSSTPRVVQKIGRSSAAAVAHARMSSYANAPLTPPPPPPHSLAPPRRQRSAPDVEMGQRSRGEPKTNTDL